MYAKEDVPQAWEDLIGCIESQGEEDAQCFDGAFGRQVAVRLLYSEVRLLYLVSLLPAKQHFLRADERTRTADLLITSDPSDVAGVCTGLQMSHI